MNVMIAAARKAARGLIRDFGEVEQLQVSRKGPADFVSQADLKAETVLLDELSRARPGYGFVLEEKGVVEGPDKSHRWIIDPLDGTTNFLHGIPHFAISIALEREGQLTAGLVYNPVRDELYRAEKGQGAHLNDRRIRVSARADLTQCLVATGIPFHGMDGHARFQQEMARVMGAVSGIRRFGAAALDLAFVAAGRFDAFWERGLKPWDIAAGIVLVREAGGEVSGLNDADLLETGDIIASNSHIHRPVQALVTPR
ncbi:MAG: inositol monophosphatase [Alphaproteobacteria bacterium]|nr:inositol monophosphatase [Alphaproteobacteria bacterium]